MSDLAEHEAEQAALTARYEALSRVQKKLHAKGVHIDDIPADDGEAHDLLIERIGLNKYDEWRADCAFDDQASVKELRAALMNLQEQVNQMRGMFPDEDGAIARAMYDADMALHGESDEEIQDG